MRQGYLPGRNVGVEPMGRGHILTAIRNRLVVDGGEEFGDRLQVCDDGISHVRK